MEQKYAIELKMLAIISVTNLSHLQTHIISFSTLISVFKEHSVYLLQSKKATIGFGLDHLAH